MTGPCKQGAKARRIVAAEGPEKRGAREFGPDLHAQSKRRVVETGNTAPREELVDETVRGDGLTVMDVSAVAEAYSHPYYNATLGAELDEQRVLAARFRKHGEFK